MARPQAVGGLWSCAPPQLLNCLHLDGCSLSQDSPDDATNKGKSWYVLRCCFFGNFEYFFYLAEFHNDVMNRTVRTSQGKAKQRITHFLLVFLAMALSSNITI